MQKMKGLCAIRGNLVYALSPNRLTAIPGGCILTEDGLVRELSPTLPEGYPGEVADYGDCLITPAFSDLHLHAPQFAMLGLGMDLQLLDWLNTYTFPAESRFSDETYAREVYRLLAKELVCRGTTRVCIYSTLHRASTHVLMEELERAGVTGYVGKVNMDRNSIPELTETTEESLWETRRFLEESKRYTRLKPILTPRFTPACSDELMAGLGKIAEEYPHIPIQSHLSENREEVEWVKKLHPDCGQYWQTYEKFGLWNEGTLMAHCVYSDGEERAAMKKAGVWAVHCPDSNVNLSSGIAPVRRMLKEGLKVALGSDIAGGARLSMWEVAAGAIRLSKLHWLQSGKRESFLTVAEAFYLITTAGQAFFGAGPGFDVGGAFHGVVFDDSAFVGTPGLTLEERLSRLLYLAEKSNVRAVYGQGCLLRPFPAAGSDRKEPVSSDDRGQ